MNRFGNVFFLPCALLISVVVLSGFADGQEPALAEALLIQRTELLQDAYYGGASKVETEHRLAEIEAQPLLAEDIRSLRQWNCGDPDYVKGMEVLSIEPVSQLYDYHTYRAAVCWDMRNLDAEYEQVVEYHLVLKLSGDVYKLAEIRPI